jgi:ribosomal protein L9
MRVTAKTVFLGPIEQVGSGYAFRFLQAGGPALVFEYADKKTARKSRLIMAKARATHKVGTAYLFEAIQDALGEATQLAQAAQGDQDAGGEQPPPKGPDDGHAEHDRPEPA